MVFVDFEFFADALDQHAIFFEIICNQTENGLNFFLNTDFGTVIDLPVKMNAKVGNGQQRPFDMQEMRDWMHCIRAFDNDAAGNAQRAIEPGIVDDAAISFDIEFDQLVVNTHFRIGFDAESRGVTMRADEAKSCLPHGHLANMECIYGRIIFGNIKTITGRTCNKRIRRIKSLIAGKF